MKDAKDAKVSKGTELQAVRLAFVYEGWLHGMRYRLYALQGEGSAGRARPPHGEDPRGRIEVGIDCSWIETFVGLLHEVGEIVMDEAGVSYDAPRVCYRKGPARRLFVMTHQDWDEVTARAGDYLACAWAPLQRAWKTASLNKPNREGREATNAGGEH